MGVLQLLYALPIGFRGFLASPAALSVFKAVTAALLLAGAAGWRARATLPLAVLGYLVFGGILRQYSAFYHAGLVPLYVLAVLVFTPCVDAWSIDRRRRASRGLPVPEPGRPAAVYGRSRYACWTVVALAYAASGLSKLRNGGLHWVGRRERPGDLLPHEPEPDALRLGAFAQTRTGSRGALRVARPGVRGPRGGFPGGALLAPGAARPAAPDDPLPRGGPLPPELAVPRSRRPAGDLLRLRRAGWAARSGKSRGRAATTSRAGRSPPPRARRRGGERRRVRVDHADRVLPADRDADVLLARPIGGGGVLQGAGAGWGQRLAYCRVSRGQTGGSGASGHGKTSAGSTRRVSAHAASPGTKTVQTSSANV